MQIQEDLMKLLNELYTVSRTNLLRFSKQEHYIRKLTSLEIPQCTIAAMLYLPTC